MTAGNVSASDMKAEIINTDTGKILFDAACVADPTPAIFDSSFWSSREAISDGRGAAHFVEYEGQRWLLKPYYRGGFIRKLSEKSYVFTGYERTRMFREFRLLQSLQARGLPVPKPVAALAQRSSWRYTGAIILERLENVTSLQRLVENEAVKGTQWQSVGRTIALFHDNGVNHTDLNASNILLRDDEVFIIDFDGCTLKPASSERSRRGNLERLQRSLMKQQQGSQDLSSKGWSLLVSAYYRQAAM
jgi:3-deoxy-D-manno-octulosonic acid kinase